MLITILALPITLQIAVADGVPNWDVTPSCRAAVTAGISDQPGDRLKTCLESEQRTHENFMKDWSTYPATDRLRCVESIQWFEPTYTELSACLEMSRDARSGRGANPIKSGPSR